VNEFPRELAAALRGRLFFLCAALACALPAALAAQPAASGAAEGSAPAFDAGSWLLIGKPGARRMALADCPSGRILAEAQAPAGLAAMPVLAGSPGGLASTTDRQAGTPRQQAPLAYAITLESELLAYELPALRQLAARRLPLEPGQLAVSTVDAGLVAVGGSGPTPLLVVDARTLADVHVYRPDRPTAIAALEHVPGRASFIAGLAQPESAAEVWELAYAADAPPVFKGLVHDYRMGEAVALPGRFTPRAAPVASPTAALLPGPAPYEWLRVDSTGQVTVLHLEVRREIARLPAAADGGWLAAAWQGEGVRGWLVGVRGARAVESFESGSWRRANRIELPGPLLALRAFAGGGSALAAVGHDRGTALVVIDGRRLQPTERQVVAARPESARLAASRDGRCIALVGEAGDWLAAVRTDR